jgi:hypothetical protein
VDAIIELVTNGGSEVESGADSDKLPDGWKGKRIDNDKVVWNKNGKVVAFSGNGAFRFKGPADQNQKLIQTIEGVNGQVGDTLDFSMMSEGKNISADASVQVKVIIYKADGTREKLRVKMDNGSYEYEWVGIPTYTAVQAFTRIKVVVMFKAQEGTWYADNISLIYNPGG